MPLKESTKDSRAPRIRWRFSAFGWRFVAAMLVVCMAFAVAATYFHVWSDAQQKKRDDHQAKAHILQHFVPRLAVAVQNDMQNEMQGIAFTLLTHSGVHRLTIDRAGQDPLVFNSFEASRTSLATQDFPLRVDDTLVGILTVGWRDAPVAGFRWKDVEDLLIFNLLESLIIGMLMLAIFDRIAARHLKFIAHKVRTTHWMETDNPNWLDRGRGIFPEQIDSIVQALNYMRNEAKNAYSSLRKQVQTTTELNASLSAANREQGELTYALSHDLITPVNTLDMLLEEVAETERLLDPETCQIVRDMHQCTKRMRQQIEAVQAYAYLLQAPLKNEHVVLDDILKDAIEQLQLELQSADASYQCDVLGDVIGDANNLKEMFVQLLRNAVRYRDSNRALSITVTSLEAENANVVRFKICDTGLGIAAGHCTDVFGLFRRLHTHSEIPGNGMGLPLVRRIVERHDGRITLSSEPNFGTCIEITLPGRVE